MDFLCEGNAGRAVAAASWRKGAKASQAWRSLRTTHGGISSLALGLSGPLIGGISSWHAGAGHRWHTGAADHQMMEFCKPGLRGAAKFLGECCHRIMKKVMRMFLCIHNRNTTCSTMRIVLSALPPSHQELLVISTPLKLLFRSKAIHGDVCV